ncbi:MAG: DNA-protecting protein DprA [Polyangiaceae bacterium]
MAKEQMFRLFDRGFPPALRELTHPPDVIWIRGEILAAPSVAIVGTRKPSPEAAAYTQSLAFRLARRGVTIWSGGAIGIDAAAHRGALEAGGTTVAVLGTGLDHCYPKEHAALYAEIVITGGALVSPFERTQFASPLTFPNRNPVLAALTQATVVIQAPFQSGARSTAKYARRLGRRLFVVPAPNWDPLGAGNLLEIALGGRPLIDESELFTWLNVPYLGAAPAPSRQQTTAPPTPSGATTAEEVVLESLSPECRAVFRVLSSTPLHLEEVCVRSGLPTALVQAALLTLSLQAVLVEGPAGWFRLVTLRKD